MTKKEVVDQISSTYGVTKSTIYQWFRGASPIGQRAGTIERVPELCYVLGALLGDGCIYHWRNRFQVWLVGEDTFTAKFASKVSACVGRRVSHYKYGSKNAWFVRLNNAELFFLFEAVRHDFDIITDIVGDAGRRRGWKEFIEGLFDAEGCVKIIGGAGRKTPKVCLDFSNTNLDLLRVAQEALQKNLGVESNISTQLAKFPRKECHHLRIYSKAGVARFLAELDTTKMDERKEAIARAWLGKRL